MTLTPGELEGMVTEIAALGWMELEMVKREPFAVLLALKAVTKKAKELEARVAELEKKI